MNSLKNYKTKKIDYTGCHPIIKKALKKGRGIYCCTHLGENEHAYIVGYAGKKPSPYLSICTQYKNAFPVQNIDSCQQFLQDAKAGKVAMDAKVMVRGAESICWCKRHFHSYKNNIFYAWANGLTSWTEPDVKTIWKYMRYPTDDELKGV